MNTASLMHSVQGMAFGMNYSIILGTCPTVQGSWTLTVYSAYSDKRLTTSHTNLRKLFTKARLWLIQTKRNEHAQEHKESTS